MAKRAPSAGLGCLVAAALVYFLNVSGTHRKRWYVTQCMRTGNAFVTDVVEALMYLGCDVSAE